ncbi:MAG: hypothetical protein ABL962_02820 [Fimbriimonadaceae bacterium]
MKVAVSARGVAHDVSRPLLDMFGSLRRSPYLLILLLIMFGGVFRGCAPMCNRPGPEPQRYVEPEEPPK